MATVARVLIERMGRLPTYLRRSLTWDRGREMADHAVITRGAVDAALDLATARPTAAPTAAAPGDDLTTGVINTSAHRGTARAAHRAAGANTLPGFGAAT